MAGVSSGRLHRGGKSCEYSRCVGSLLIGRGERRTEAKVSVSRPGSKTGYECGKEAKSFRLNIVRLKT